MLFAGKPPASQEFSFIFDSQRWTQKRSFIEERNQNDLELQRLDTYLVSSKKDLRPQVIQFDDLERNELSMQ